MKLDEFAFVNQQLAGMLRSGIPLEGSLQQLCATMREGRLRDELQKLEADLTSGRPLAEALRARQLPPLYAQMLQVGAQSNDLPGVLTLLADHYERLFAIWTRMKGLLTLQDFNLVHFPAPEVYGVFAGQKDRKAIQIQKTLAVG
jgi:type II secretory pathway component PulF